jgi:hypothetical protein
MAIRDFCVEEGLVVVWKDDATEEGIKLLRPDVVLVEKTIR